MKCPKCKFQNPDKMQFCGKCGSKLALICNNCCFENPKGFGFCGKCGNSLQQTSGATVIDYKTPQSYTPKHLADKILTTRSSIEGERKLVTILFADVANYTSISERLDPEEVHQIMDGCFNILMEEIHKYEGTINQFTGDGVMALFGAPVAHEDHAHRACRSAITIQNALDQYSKKLELKFDIQFKMRIGINSGLVVVGSIGDDLRMDYTAVGDSTNLAARIESFAKPGTILISEDTHKIIRDFFEIETKGKIEIKGKEKLQSVFQLIRTGDVKTRMGASIAKGLTRFVGRQNSMSTLVGALEKAKSGSGQIVGIVGEAGIGKSRLLFEMRNLFPQVEFEYLEGRCLQYSGSILYLPILDILKSIFNINDDDKEFVVKRKIKESAVNFDKSFSRLNSSFQDILSLKVDDEEHLKLEPKEKREKIFEAIRNLLIRMSQNKPLIIAIEDLHWIDKTSEDFLNFFIDWLANTSIVLILLYRPEYTHQWGSKSFYTKIGVDQLAMNSSGELVKAILGKGGVSPELSQLIFNRSAGNPLFMEEFTRTLIETGAIEKLDNQYIFRGNFKDIKVPDTIQGIIASRMDRLEDNVKRTMQVAAVIGRDFAFRILDTITGMHDELKFHLQNLQGLEFIYEKQLFPELVYIFKHALTQEVAYNSLLRKRRNEIHEKIGLALEELYSERLEEFYEMLAYHYFRSDNHKKAFEYLKLSGLKATQRHSSLEAIQFFEKAIEALNYLGMNEAILKKKLEIIHLTTFPMLHLGYPTDFLSILQEGVEISKKLRDNHSLAILNGCMGSYYAYLGKPIVGMEYADKAFSEAKITKDIELIAPVTFEMVAPYIGSGEFYKIIKDVQYVISLIEKNNREPDYFGKPMNVYSALSARCGGFMGYLGNLDDGKTLLLRSHLNAKKVDDKRSLAIVELYSGHLFLWKCDWEIAVEHYQNCIEYSENMNWKMFLALAWSGLGYTHSFLGNLEIAENYIKKGINIQLEAGIEWWLSFQYFFLSHTYFEQNNFKLAQIFIEKALEFSQKNNEKMVEGCAWLQKGLISEKTELQKMDTAETYIIKGIKMLEKLKFKTFYSQGYFHLGNHYLSINKKEKALDNLNLAKKMFQEMKVNHWLDKTQTLIERV